jgi:hypothetical protein
MKSLIQELNFQQTQLDSLGKGNSFSAEKKWPKEFIDKTIITLFTGWGPFNWVTSSYLLVENNNRTMQWKLSITSTLIVPWTIPLLNSHSMVAGQQALLKSL